MKGGCLILLQSMSRHVGDGLSAFACNDRGKKGKGLHFLCRPSAFTAKLFRPRYLSGLVSAGSSAGRFGKLGCPGGGGSAEGLSLPGGLNSLALTLPAQALAPYRP